MTQQPSPAASTPAPDPWARWPAETYQAYRGFTAYLRVFPGRSVAGAYRLRNWPEVGLRDAAAAQPSGRWKAWAGAYRWRERADAFDRAMARAAYPGDDIWSLRRERAAAIERLMPAARPPTPPVCYYLPTETTAELLAWMASRDASGCGGDLGVMPAELNAKLLAGSPVPASAGPGPGGVSAAALLKEATAAVR